MNASAFFVLFGLLLISHLASGQAEPPLTVPLITPGSDAAITATSAEREGLIHLDVSIADRSGKTIGGLTASDLPLLDNGVSEKILSLRASNAAGENERLSEVAIVLDDLDLPDNLVEPAKEDVIKYLRQNRDLAQPISVYQLTSTGFYFLAGGRDGYELAAGVISAPARERRQGRPFANWDTALRSVYSLAVGWREGPGRKALVWIGPGWPVDAGFVPESAVGSYFRALVELTSRILDARMVIYQVSPGPDLRVSEFGVDDAKGVQSASQMGNCFPQFALRVLATQSGGLLLNGGDVVRNIERGVQDAGTFYTLSFDPPPAGRADEYHDLKVQVGTLGAAARTTTGYYNQPVFYDQPRIPAQRVTVQQLEEFLQRASEEADGELAQQLSGTELTERLSSNKLASLLRQLHGKQSKGALTVLADTSAYLDPPASEIASNPAPDLESQAQMVKRTVQYLLKILPTLPDFYATRTLAEYDQRVLEEGTWKTAYADQSLHESITENATLFYRNGNEEQVVHKRKGKDRPIKGLNFFGIFGPILNRVLHDAGSSANGLAWSRWEHDAEGNEAVFRYSVHMDDPSYEVVSCCLRNGNVFRTRPEYHGEMAIDPETGAVLRLTMESVPGWIVEPNLKPVQLVKATGMMLEYGPVQLGGENIHLSASQRRHTAQQSGETASFLRHASDCLRTLRNDHGRYRLYRLSQVRLGIAHPARIRGCGWRAGAVYDASFSLRSGGIVPFEIKQKSFPFSLGCRRSSQPHQKAGTQRFGASCESLYSGSISRAVGRRRPHFASRPNNRPTGQNSKIGTTSGLATIQNATLN